MFRFFCVICRRVKRVRRQPAVLANPGAFHPTERSGSCDSHTYDSRGAMLRARRPARTRHVIITKKAAPAPQPKSKKSKRQTDAA